MNSIIFQTIARFLTVTLYFISLWLLFRGHNQPGGGFVAGLIFGAAFSIRALAFGVENIPYLIREKPLELTGVGLLLAVVAGMLPFLTEQAFLTGVWVDVPLGFTSLHLGSPILFDLGVFLVVLAVVASLVMTLLKTEEERPEVK